MRIDWTFLREIGKPLGRHALWVLFLTAGVIAACGTNPATGDRQFTGLLPESQEARVGSSEHEKVVQEYGIYKDSAVQNYVRGIGNRIIANTERPNVNYQFYVVDSPVVNAFALPGGYVYVSRGLLALANNEAEVAAVMAHEIGHVTARHSAERFSHGVLAGLGAAVISAAVDNSGISQALGLGSNLYLSSYSRGQENEADTLGMRYLSRAGYDVRAMPAFLQSLQSQVSLDNRIDGKSGSEAFNYFSTHPATGDRVAQTSAAVASYPQGGVLNREGHMDVIDGLVYGDSAKQGYIKGQSFYHPELGFGFSVPQGFTLVNQPSQVIATSPTGAAIIFDMVKASADPMTFLTQTWLKEQSAQNAERIEINGMPAASAMVHGQVNGQAMNIQLVSVRWDNNTIARFQIGIPSNASAQLREDLRRSTYSLHRLSASERNSLRPQVIQVITARPGDTAASLAQSMPFPTYREERFRVLNGLFGGQQVQPGVDYKLVVE